MDIFTCIFIVPSTKLAKDETNDTFSHQKSIEILAQGVN